MFSEQQIGAIVHILSDSKVREGKTEFLEEIREKAEQLEPHFEDDYPDKLLRHQHPGEELWMREYRKHRWTGATLMATSRIYSSLQKIQQADDFKIKIEEDPVKTGIAEINSFSVYLTKELPKFKSLETWLFQPFLRKYLEDANSVQVILPDLEKWIETGDSSTVDFSKPFPQEFESEDIVYKKEGGLIVKLDDYKINGQDFNQFLAVAKEGVLLLKQIRAYNSKDANVFEVYDLGVEFYDYPVINAGSIICEIEDGEPIFDSVIQGCVPALNEVLYRHSDLIINWALHGNPQKWEIVGKKCKTCKGSGVVANGKGELNQQCGTCNGSGVSKGSPFGVIEIDIQQPNATNPNVANIPTPPVGYAERPIDTLDAQKQDINDNLYRAFQAVGLELLANVPAPQSGLAKQYDRKEINTFFFQVAEHLKNVYIQTAKCIYFQRYTALGLFANGLLNQEKIDASIPSITVPSDFDILTTDILAEQLSKAKKDGYNPIITTGLEYDYTEKLYGENSPVLKVLKAINELDPLPFKSAEDKMLLKESGGCSNLDYILSSYIKSFITEKLEEDEQWLKKPKKEQRADLRAMALEKEKEIKAGIVPLMDVGA